MTSGAPCPRTARARTRCTSRPSTAASAASRSTCAARRGARSSRTSCESSDAVYSNLRGDQPEKLRITYAHLGALNPRIVCCSLSGFGMTGPRRAEPAVRLRAAGAHGLDEPDRRAGRAAGEVRALAGGLQRRLRQRARAAGRRLAGAPRRRRLRLRHVAVRDRALAADLRGHVGGVARARHRAPRGVRAPVDRPLPGLPDRRRLDHGRRGQAEVLARAVRGAGAGAGVRSAVRRLRGARRASRAVALAPAAADRRAAHRGGDRPAERARACRAGRSTTSSARSRTRRSRPATRSSPTSIRRWARCASRPRPSGSGRSTAARRGAASTPRRSLRELCGYDDEALLAAREGGAFG